VWRLREGWARLPIGVRFLWLLLGVMLALMTPLLGLGYLFLRQSLEAHQQLVQSRRLIAAISALDRELAALLRQVQDYTVWNDAHAAVHRRDVEWVRRNIVDWLPGQFYYDFAVVVDAEGAWVAHTAGEWAWLRQTTPFQRAMRGIGNAGLHRRGERIYILAAAPIVDEEWSRLPAGVLIVGKAINETLLRRVSQSAGHAGALQVQAVSNPPSPQPSPPLVRGVRGGSNRTSPSTRNLLYDSASRPIAWLQIEPPRAEQSWLLESLYLAKRYLFVFGGVLALIASLTMVLLLQSHLRRFAVVIQRLTTGDWDARIAYPARDEFGYLARAFNQMAYQLQQAFEAQEQQREELLAQNEELERMHEQLQQAHQSLATLNAELLEANRALAQAAVTDGLTGLKNHRAFQEMLHSAAQMAERLRQPLSLIMFDIDHFKQFNDRFGHPAGDELLQKVAQALRESARAYDVAARYGGEEFALLLPNTALEQAVQVAERLRQQIRAIENPHAPVSASFGVATYRHGMPPATLVYEADAALYRAKHCGRDQVCVYQTEAI
jgi:diguanylate cyclase (GGDEF)-like protein